MLELASNAKWPLITDMRCSVYVHHKSLRLQIKAKLTYYKSLRPKIEAKLTYYKSLRPKIKAKLIPLIHINLKYQRCNQMKYQPTNEIPTCNQMTCTVIHWNVKENGGWRGGGRKSLCQYKRNVLFQLLRFNEISKISTSSSRPKGCKNEAHDDLVRS